MFFLGETVVFLVLTMCAVWVRKSGLVQRFCSRESKASPRHSNVLDQVPANVDQSIRKKPYKLPPMKLGTSPHLTMGLRRHDASNWLTVDDQYLPEHKIRAHHLSKQMPSVLQCLPGSESACGEVLSMVSSFLTSRYPWMFRFSGEGAGQLIHNLMTGEVFPVLNNPQPLEAAVRLAMEDFNLLIKDPNDGQYRLQASATLFPAGWRLEERIGSTLEDLHCPVPGWKKKLGASVNRYFDYLSESNAMERHAVFVQNTPVLFQDEALCSLSTDSDSDIVQSGPKGDQTNDKNGGSHPDSIEKIKPFRLITPVSLPPLASEIHVRRERQTFKRLPGCQAILFAVRTYIMPLTSLSDEELDAFVEQAQNWDEGMAAYKGRERWWDAVLAYQQTRKDGLLLI